MSGGTLRLNGGRVMHKIIRFFKQQEQTDMASGPVGSTLVKLAVPLMTSLLFQNLYAFIDTVFVSWLGNIPLAAVSLAVPLMYLALSLAKGIAMGSVVLISHARGAGEEVRAKTIAESVLTLMTLTMGLFVPLMLPEVCRVFFSALGAGEFVLPHLYGFTFWLIAGFPVMGFVMTAEALFMARGNTVTPMKAMVIGNIINVCLDPLFIFTCKFGAAGAAMATLTGQAVAGIYLYRCLADRGYERPVILFRSSMVREWKLILGQGIFIALSYMIIPMGLMLLNTILARFGTAAVAAWNMMSRMEMLVMLPIMGLSNAMAAFISFNLGRREYERIRSVITVFLKFSLAVVVPASLLFLLFPHELVAVFRPTPELLLLSGYAVRASGVAGIFMILVFALIGVAQGLKRPVYMVALSAVHAIGLRVPVAYLLAARWGETGVFWSHTTAAAGAALLAGFLIRRLLLKSLVEEVPAD